MKKLTFILLSIAALSLASCDNISPEVANAFKGEYWMETTNIGIINGKEEPLNASSSWTPVSIFEKGGKLYVQTEMLGAPDLNNNHPKEVEGTKERPNFIAPYEIPAEEGDTASGIENIETGNKSSLYVMNGYIVLSGHGVRLAQTLPIKVKSGSETVLNLEPYKREEVAITNAMGESLGTMHAWYEYGPMVKKGETISWDVDYKDDYTPSNSQELEYDRIIHRNVLYKRK